MLLALEVELDGLVSPTPVQHSLAAEVQREPHRPKRPVRRPSEVLEISHATKGAENYHLHKCEQG